jgi:hypothetical protein
MHTCMHAPAPERFPVFPVGVEGIPHGPLEVVGLGALKRPACALRLKGGLRPLNLQFPGGWTVGTDRGRGMHTRRMRTAIALHAGFQPHLCQCSRRG